MKLISKGQGPVCCICYSDYHIAVDYGRVMGFVVCGECVKKAHQMMYPSNMILMGPGHFLTNPAANAAAAMPWMPTNQIVNINAAAAAPGLGSCYTFTLDPNKCWCALCQEKELQGKSS